MNNYNSEQWQVKQKSSTTEVKNKMVANLLRAEGFYIESEVWYFYQNILTGKWWLQLKLGTAREPNSNLSFNLF